MYEKNLKLILAQKCSNGEDQGSSPLQAVRLSKLKN